METFFFGKSSHSLYGVYHPAVGRNDLGRAVLVCYPVGREYLVSHNMVVNLCESLANSGIHTLRFDYYATGDSAGMEGEATSEDWLADIETAAEELKDITGVQSISGIGVRFGGTLLAKAACGRGDFARIVLWDPIVSGEQYINALVHLHRKFVLNLDRFPYLRKDALGNNQDDLLGYRFAANLRDSIIRINILDLDWQIGRSTVLCGSSESEEVAALHHHIKLLSPEVQYRIVDEPTEWGLGETGDIIIAPQMSALIHGFISGS